MRSAGQICLWTAFVAFGYAGFACWIGARRRQPSWRRTGTISAGIAMATLTAVVILLARALIAKDFGFQYVAQYSSRLLPWHYSLSALWVGQAGSLLLWTWLLGALALVFRCGRRTQLRDSAFGLVMMYCGFLAATMVFAADPTEANIAPGQEGAGLSPLLQHPAMLIHPPIVFLGYAAWTIPCALAISALTNGSRTCKPGDVLDAEADGQHDQASPLDASWVQMARPWALFAWVVLGSGILIGANWSYEELGWGGYWAWDPVENGSLIPWLIGGSLIHSLMAWQIRGILKKTCICSAIAVFGMCNFATFLTRSGIFSSLHAFSQSPIGWLFLGMMLSLTIGASVLILRQRQRLLEDHRFTSVWSRESFVVIALLALLLLATVTFVGTLSGVLSAALIGRQVLVGVEFYDYTLMVLGPLLLAAMVPAPLLRWGSPPTSDQCRGLLISSLTASVVAVAAGLCGARQLLLLIVVWLSCICHDSAADINRAGGLAVCAPDALGETSERRWQPVVARTPGSSSI